jgi:hypothetical protein
MTRSVAPSRTSPRTILRSLRMSGPVLLVIAVLSAAAIPVVLLINGKSETTAREAATRFAAALVQNDPGAAPAGGGDDVRRLRTHFGAVTDARVISVHNKHVNSVRSRSTRSFVVAELLLRTARGPAVIELEFPGAPFGDRVDGVHELPPGRASGLSGQEYALVDDQQPSIEQRRAGQPRGEDFRAPEALRDGSLAGRGAMRAATSASAIAGLLWSASAETPCACTAWSWLTVRA